MNISYLRKYLNDLRHRLPHPKKKYWFRIGLTLSLGCLALCIPLDHPAHATSSLFNEHYQQAQKQGWTTGNWGNAPYYIDDKGNMYVGAGQLQGNFLNTVGPDMANRIQTLDFTSNVQAPQDSSFLFSNANGNQANHALTAIDGLDKVDMSHVTSAYAIFSRDTALNDLGNVNDWNMGQVQDLSYAFYDVNNLEKLNLHDWNTSNTNNMIHMFDGASYLQNLDVTGVNTQHADVSDMFDNDYHLFWLTLGNNFQIKYTSHLAGGPWGSYMGSSANSLMPMSENDEESIYDPSNGIWPGSWLGSYNLDGNNGALKSDNDVSDSTYMGNRFDAAGSYTDKHGNMYIGQGQIQDSISQVTNSHLYVPGEDYNSAQQGLSNSNLRTVSLTAPTVTSGLSFYSGPEFNWNSVGMFSNSANLTNIYGANNFDASSAGSLNDFFANDPKLQDLDVSKWDVTKQYDIGKMFANDTSLNSLDLSHWDTAGNQDNATQTDMFANDTNLSDLYLGKNTKLKPESHLPDSTWVNADTGAHLNSAQLTDNNSHPGEWYHPSFERDQQHAKQNGWQTGYWGTAPWYIDDHDQMHVGNGRLQGTLYDTTGVDTAKNITRLSFDEPVQAPQDSSSLLSTSYSSFADSSLTNIDNLKNVDMSSVRTARAMFANDTKLPGIDTTGLNLQNTTDMSFMFAHDSSLVTLNSADLDTSHATNFDSMFANDINLQDPNIGSWDVRNVQQMSFMFWGDSNIRTLGIENWHPDSLESMDSMFLNDYGLQTVDLSHWDPTQLRNLHSAFVNDHSLNGNMDLGNWRTPNLRTTESTFNGANVRHANLANLDTSHNVNMPFMFDNNRNLDTLTLNENTHLNENDRLTGIEWQNNGQDLHTSDLNDGTGHPGNWQQTRFSYDYQTAQQKGWKTGQWGSADYYIDNNSNMYIGFGHLNSNLANTVGSERASSLHSINFMEPVQAPQNSSFLLSTSNWNLNSNSNLTNINGLNQVDTSQATDLDCVFTNDYRLNHLDLSSWDTSHVNTMQFAFYNNQALTDLHVSNWDTSHVTDMYSLFSQSSNLDHLDLSHWNTSKVNDMEYVFYHDDELSELNLNGWDTSQRPNRFQMFGNDQELQDINLGPQMSLSHDTGLADGMWLNDSTTLTLSEMTNEEPHPGTWFFAPVHQDSSAIQGTEYDNLEDLIKQKYQVPNDQVMILRDDHSLRSQQDQMNPGDYDNVIFTLQSPNGNNQGFYHAHLHVQAYTAGDALQGHAGQPLHDLLEQRYGDQVRIEDTDDSTDDGNSLNAGDYQIRYRYPDAQGNWHYQIAPLHVDYYTTTDLPFLIVNDHPNEEIYDQADIQRQLTEYFGATPDARLSLSNVHDDTANYTLTSGKNSYNGTLKVIPSLQQSIDMNNIPDASDTVTWHRILGQSFSSDNGITLTNPTNDELVNDTDHGKAQMQGTLYPDEHQSINNPAIPYSLSMTVDSSERSVDNTINDQQVNDVLHSIDPHTQVISVIDSQGEDMTPSLHALSTIKNNTDITVKMQTSQGLITLHLASVNDLVEPNVDINGGDLASQIQAQTHESDFQNFGVDNTHQLTPNVQEVDYHFTKNVQANGNNVHVGTNNVTVSGTAYVHSKNINSASPTYMIVQGTNAIQHIENVLGTQINVTQFSNGQDINHLPVGSYQMTYQRVDDASATENPAQITVIPNYYFGSITNDPSFDQNDPARDMFETNDYQHNGNYYKSIVNTNDTSQDQDNDSHHKEQSDTVDGLHTSDGKPAHFDAKNPYLK